MTKQEQACRRATVGLVADNVSRIDVHYLYSKVKDQCDRIGCHPPSLPVYINILEGYCSFTTDEGEIVVHLPEIDNIMFK